MPRIPENTPKHNSGQASSTVIRVDSVNPKREQPRGNTAVYIQENDVDLKLKVLASSVAKDFLPLNFDSNKDIKEKAVSELANTAYVFVDDAGKPVKVLAPSVLREEILWDDLSEDAKQHIQAAIDAVVLSPGRNITISGNVISASIGVETVNNKTGKVILTADDLNAYSKEQVYTKEETYNKTEINTIVDNISIDGGRIV